MGVVSDPIFEAELQSGRSSGPQQELPSCLSCVPAYSRALRLPLYCVSILNYAAPQKQPFQDPSNSKGAEQSSKPFQRPRNFVAKEGSQFRLFLLRHPLLALRK